MSDKAFPAATTRVALVVPIFNEEFHAQKLLDRIRPVVESGLVQKAIFTDDGSTDRTSEILRRAEFVEVVRHPNRRGCGASIRSGYEVALREGFDAVVVMAGNGKDDPGEIPRLLRPIFDDKADYVQGSRFMTGGVSGGLPPHRLLAMRLLTLLFQVFLLRRFTDSTNGFRAYRTRFLKDPRVGWNQAWLGNDYEMEIYLHYQATALGFRVVEVPVSKIYTRVPGMPYSKARLADWFTGMKPLFLLRFGLRR